jgi:hypothetical protein
MNGPVAASLVCALLLPAPVGAAQKAPSGPSPLTAEHWSISKAVSLRTPASWRVESSPGEPEVTEARGDGLIVRVLRREGELGLDSLHVECMLARLAHAMDTFPQVDYEYDFVGGQVGGRRALDSAFVVHYDGPVEGHKDWRQRNITVVGEGESVCVVAYAPLPVWKKTKAARNLLTSVIESIRFPKWP